MINKLGKICKQCGRIIIYEFEKWLKENKNQTYIQCPYCFYMEKINGSRH